MPHKQQTESATAATVEEQRKHPRIPARGHVEIVIDEPYYRKLEGELIDISASGFRAAHDHLDLRNGQTIGFRHKTAAGTARVIWNRIVANRIETGFLIV